MSSFVKVFKNIDKAVNAAKKQALQRAGNSTRAQYVKEISDDLGISGKRAKSRAVVYSKNKTNDVSLSIGVRSQLNAHDFKIKPVKVDTSSGQRIGAQYTVKGRAPETTTKGFIVKAQSGKNLVMQRTGDSRYGIEVTKVDVFIDAVTKLVPSLKSHIKKAFEDHFKSRIKYFLTK